MTIAHLDQMNLCEAALAVAQGEVSSQQLTEHAINRLKEVGPKLNCVVSIHEEKALDSAYEADKVRSLGKPLGPLHGVPLAHKELFYRQGVVSNNGSIISEGFLPSETSTVLTRLDQAGAIDVGQLPDRF
jgi:aspartyl-tRNA(Asn)/glutamyl-tRNA(Gln) amidotransferase subunit A